MPPPVVTLGLALIAGVAVASLWPGDAVASLLGALALVVAAGAAGRFARRAAWWLTVGGVALIGVTRGVVAAQPPPANDISAWNGANVTVVGVVDDEPTVRETFVRFRLVAQTVDDGGGPVSATGALLVDLPPDA
ncbi:MAG: DUF4131 domain-containing protein, partial [Dehalococcoidia bacterium]|nr:DUF4131 domain-containing protein [Dehalococcoidia bacterium]